MFRLAFSAALLGWLANADEKRCLNAALNSYARCGDVATLIHAPGQLPSIFLGRDYDNLLDHVGQEHGSETEVLMFKATVGAEEYDFTVADQESLERALALAGMLGVLPQLHLPPTDVPTLSPTPPPTAAPTSDCLYRHIKYENIRVRNPDNKPGATYGNHFCLYKVEFYDANGEKEPAKVEAYYPGKAQKNAYTDLTNTDVITDDSNDSHWCNHFGRWGKNEGWVQWDMGAQVKVAKYKIWAHHTWNFPYEWKIMGSNDGKTWTRIDYAKEGEDGFKALVKDSGLQMREFLTDCN